MTTRNLAAAVSAAALAASAGGADAFIESGWPAADVSYAAASAATALETGTRTASGGASALEARFRTRAPSNRIGLRSDAYHAMILILK